MLTKTNIFVFFGDPVSLKFGEVIFLVAMGETVSKLENTVVNPGNDKIEVFPGDLCSGFGICKS